MSYPLKKHDMLFSSKKNTLDEKKRIERFFKYENIWDYNTLLKELNAVTALKKQEKNETAVEQESAMYGSSKTTYDTMSDALKIAGFVPVIEQSTVSLQYDIEKQINSLWAHPRGVLFKMETSRWGCKDELDEKQWFVGSSYLYFQINNGSGYLSYMASYSNPIQGSTSMYLLPTGEHVKELSVSVSDPMSLFTVLSNAQSIGKMLPFAEQCPDTVSYHLDKELFISPELLTPLLEHNTDDASSFNKLSHRDQRKREFFKTNATTIARNYWEQLLIAVEKADQMIPGLGQCLAASEYYKSKEIGLAKGDEKILDSAIVAASSDFGISFSHDRTPYAQGPLLQSKPIKIDLRTLEQPVLLIGNQADYSMDNRFRSAADISLTTTWANATRQFLNNTIQWDQIDWNATTSDGINFIHYCIMLDEKANHNTTKCSAALQAFERCPVDILERLCSTSLPDGTTLPMLIFSRLMFNSQYRFEENVLFNERFNIFNSLNEKVPAALWNLGTKDEATTCMGAWTKGIVRYFNDRYSHGSNLLACQSLCRFLEDLGAEVPSNIQFKWPAVRSEIVSDKNSNGHRVLAPLNVQTEDVMDVLSLATKRFSYDAKNRDEYFKILLNEVLSVEGEHTQNKTVKKRKM